MVRSELWVCVYSLR